MDKISNDLFKELFTSAADALFILKKGRITICNPAASDFFKLDSPKKLNRENPFTYSPKYQPNGETSILMAESYISEAESMDTARFEWLHLIGGKGIWVEYNLSKINKEEDASILAVVREIGRYKDREIIAEKRIEGLILHNQALGELSTVEAGPHFTVTLFKQKLIEIAADTLKADYVGIWIKSKGKDRLEKETLESNGKSSLSHLESIKLKEFPRFEKALAEHQLIVVHDAFKDPRTNELKPLNRKKTKSSSLLLVPLVSGGKLQGLLWIEKANPPYKWEFEEQSFALSLGEMLAKQIGLVQKRKVERKLEKREKVFKALVNHSLDMVCIIDSKGKLSYQSPAFESVLGFDENELLGKSAFGFIHPDDRVLAKRYIELINEPGKVDSFIYRAQHKNGNWVYIEALANNLLNDPEIKGVVVNMRDITERLQFQHQLEHKEKYYRSLIENSGDAFLISDENTNFIYASPSIERILGFKPEEFIKLNGRDLVHPDHRKYSTPAFDECLKNPGKAIKTEFLFQDKSGGYKFLELIFYNQLHDEAINGVVMNCRDISDRKKNEEALIQKEQYYRTLIEKSLDVTIVWDKEGTMKYVSPSVERVFGIEENELIGSRGFAQTHPEDLEQFEADWDFIQKHPGQPLKLDQRIILPNGDIRFIEGTIRNLLDVEPVAGLVANFRDATGRKNAETALIESQMRLEGIISSAIDAIITVDNDHNIVLFNASAEKMFNYNAFDLFGNSMELILPQEYIKIHASHIQNFQASSENKRKMGSPGKQLQGRKSDGTLFPIDVSISKQTIEDEVFFTAIVRDITEQLKSEQVMKEYNKTLEGEVESRTRLINRKNYELNKTLEELKNTQEQLVESEKMASLGQLTAGIAHEINNPINFVTSTISPLKRDFKQVRALVENIQKKDNASKQEGNNSGDIHFLFEEITQLLNGIEEGAKRTKNIVLGLRNFSRLEEESFKKTNLHDGLDSTLMLLNSRIRGRIEVLKKYRNIPPVECLPGKINQVFMNILTNAIQAIENQGEIGIRTSFEKDKNEVKVEITDSGSGMNNEVRKRVFEPFFTTKDVGIGTGLGLSISYGIIEKHGGNIEVKSKQGKGSTFAISLPVSQF